MSNAASYYDDVDSLEMEDEDEDYEPNETHLDQIEDDDDEDDIDEEMDMTIDLDDPAEDGEPGDISNILQQLLAAARRSGRGQYTLADIQALVGVGTTRSAAQNDSDDEETDLVCNWFPQPTQPQEAGTELLMSGDFGRVRNKIGFKGRHVNSARRILDRAGKLRPPKREDLAHGLVPNSNGVAVANYAHNVYSGQFSQDSSFYYVCCQDFRIHVYDMLSGPNPYSPSSIRRDGQHHTTLKVTNSINCNHGNWTITDSHLAPDNERMIYAAMTSTVYMTSITQAAPAQTPIPFHIAGENQRTSIYSTRFSADGNEVVAGGTGHIFVYDLLSNRRTVKIAAHEDDVNSCCWADVSGNILISGSDDTFVKVWDRRSLGSSQRPSGVFIGHTEGVTSVAPKGDGRYIVSNGKDQAVRLWDLRRMASDEEYQSVSQIHYGHRGWDYRRAYYPKPRRSAHPKDCSVMTYRGHSVLRTLIRCNFSPAETTGAQYIYSGSADGKIHIWSLDGRIVNILDRSQGTLPLSFDPAGPEPVHHSGRRGSTSVVVRDVAWSSQEPVLLSTGWESSGYSETSVVARHEFKGLMKTPGALEDWVEKNRMEELEQTSALQIDED